MGDRPGPVWPSDDPVGGFGDTDGGPAKSYLWEHRARYPELFQAAFGKRPALELYAVRSAPLSSCTRSARTPTTCETSPATLPTGRSRGISAPDSTPISPKHRTRAPQGVRASSTRS